MPDQQIPGVPEGVRIVRVGIPRPDEFEHVVKLIGGRELGFIYQNRPGMPAPGNIVEPIEGYHMVMDPTTKTYLAKKIEAPAECLEEFHAVKVGDVMTFAFEFQGQPAGTKFKAMLPEDPTDLRGAQLIPIT
jgi:hypothetical protein